MTFRDIKESVKSVFGIIFVKGELDRLKINFNDFKNETRQGFLRIQWDNIYVKSFECMSDELYKRACEIYDRYIEAGGNWYVHNEMEGLTVRYNDWKKSQKKGKKK